MAAQETKYICSIVVLDPDSQLPVEIEVRKCVESGAMIGLDGSWLDQCEDDAADPYNPGQWLHIPDNETGGRVEYDLSELKGE